MKPDPRELAQWRAEIRLRCAGVLVERTREILQLVADGDRVAAFAVAVATDVEINLILCEPPPWLRPSSDPQTTEDPS